VTIPVKVIAGLVLMQGEVNNSGPLNVILDTGSSISIVNLSAAGKLGLASTHSTEAAGIAKGFESDPSLVQRLRIEMGQ
jgi:hypothetical protein